MKVVTALGYPLLPAFDSAGIITGLFSQQNSTYGPSLLIDMEDAPKVNTPSAIWQNAPRERVLAHHSLPRPDANQSKQSDFSSRTNGVTYAACRYHEVAG